jgi:hypothetical protein
MGVHRASTMAWPVAHRDPSGSRLSNSAIWRIPPIDLQVEVAHIQNESFSTVQRSANSSTEFFEYVPDSLPLRSEIDGRQQTLSCQSLTTCNVQRTCPRKRWSVGMSVLRDRF